jgi:hypothetical protein
MADPVRKLVLLNTNIETPITSATMTASWTMAGVRIGQAFLPPRVEQEGNQRVDDRERAEQLLDGRSMRTHHGLRHRADRQMHRDDQQAEERADEQPPPDDVIADDGRQRQKRDDGADRDEQVRGGMQPTRCPS